MIVRYRQFAIFLIATCACLTGVAGQNATATWRCGNSYGDQACASGKTVEAADLPSAADRRARDAATRRERATADALEHDRLQREAQARRESRPIVIGKTPPAPAISAPKPGKTVRKTGKAPEYFTAHGPQAASEKRKKKSAS